MNASHDRPYWDSKLETLPRAAWVNTRLELSGRAGAGRTVCVCGRVAYVACAEQGGSSQVCGERPVVVFVHGAGQDHRCWDLYRRWFARHGYMVVAPDLPGHGRSSGAALASVEALAAWLVALLDALGVGQAAVVAYSMGSLIALEAVLAYPRRFARLALLGCALPMPVSAHLLDAARNDEAQAVALIDRYSYTTGSRRDSATLARQRPGVLAIDLAACNAYARPLASLASLVDVDLLIISGDADRMTRPAAARQIAQVVPRACLMVVAGGGHALIAERPGVVLDGLRSFLDTGA